MKRSLAICSAILLGLAAASAIMLLRPPASNDAPSAEHVQAQGPSCPGTSMTEAQAEARAITYANLDSFLNPVVIVSDLLTADQLRDQHGIVPVHTSDCFWYVKMKGSKVEDRYPPGIPATPTPGPGTTYVSLTMAMDSVTGYEGYTLYETIPLFTPQPSTPGAYPTFLLPPTEPAPPPTPLAPTE